MERWQKACIAGLVLATLSFVAFSVGYGLGNGERDPAALLAGDDPAPEVIDDAFEEIRSSAVDPPDERELARGAIRGMVEVLKASDDPYALFYTPDGYRAFREYTAGHFSGIGVWLKEKNDALEIVSVLPSTPALESGLERGDVIERIEGDSVDGMTVDEAVGLIKGPPGTDVSLVVDRNGTTLDFILTRETIELPNVAASLREEDLGYIRLYGFARGAGRQVRTEVERLTSSGAEGLVLDLRDNGGGLFTEAIDVASVFLEDGRIVTYRAGSEPDRNYRAEGEAFEDVPLVVLVNEGTASASEIVAGALQDRERAILVGTTTYGKGSVQKVFPLPDASALKLTTGAYVTPGGRNINGSGIEPDVEVDDEGNVKDRAVEILRGIVISTTGAQG